MYYVQDGTERAGYYECEACGERFLDVRIAPSLVCPYCGEVPDMEIGPDEEMPEKNLLALLPLLQILQEKETKPKKFVFTDEISEKLM